MVAVGETGAECDLGLLLDFESRWGDGRTHLQLNSNAFDRVRGRSLESSNNFLGEAVPNEYGELLRKAGGRRAPASSLGGKLLARSLASGGFTCVLLGAGHFE